MLGVDVSPLFRLSKEREKKTVTYTVSVTLDSHISINLRDMVMLQRLSTRKDVRSTVFHHDTNDMEMHLKN